MSDTSNIDPKSLNPQCVLDKVTITLEENDTSKLVGAGHLTFYINENPVDKEVLAVRFSDDEDNEQATIVLVSTSTAWLQEDKILVFTRPKGGVWKVDCSQSEEKAFKELLDILSFFIVFENRQGMRNMLVMINPETCEVMEVVAEGVQLDRVDSSGNLQEEEADQANAEDEKEGEKLPVCIETVTDDEDEDEDEDKESEVPKSRRVRILNSSANALLSGSTWLSQQISQGGSVVAKQISSGGKMLEDSVDATNNPIKISENSKSYFESAYNKSASVRQIANGLTDQAAATTLSTVDSLATKATKMVSGEQEEAEPEKEISTIGLGKAALQSAAKVFGSVFKAKREILTSSRESVVNVVHKKYGEDASMVVDKTLGVGYNLSCMMVYFDAKGVSRRVATKGAIQTATKNKQKEMQGKQQPQENQVQENQVQENQPQVNQLEGNKRQAGAEVQAAN